MAVSASGAALTANAADISAVSPSGVNYIESGDYKYCILCKGLSCRIRLLLSAVRRSSTPETVRVAASPKRNSEQILTLRGSKRSLSPIR